MSSLGWIIALVLILTLTGTAALLFVTIKYYWAARGTPPAVGDEKKRLHEEELRMRASQIERARQNPVKPRNPSFWDNRKVG